MSFVYAKKLKKITIKSPHVSIDNAVCERRIRTDVDWWRVPEIRRELGQLTARRRRGAHTDSNSLRSRFDTSLGAASSTGGAPRGSKGRSRTGRVGPARKAPRHTSPSPNEREARTDRGERDGGPGDGRGDRAHHDQDQAAGARGRALPDSRRRRACPR